MKQELINDPYFRVEVLSKTERPNLLSYLALHQCYAEGSAVDDLEKLSKLSEAELGRRVVDKCVKFGHWSVVEAPTISFNVIGFPHNVMVQATRHRHISFSCLAPESKITLCTQKVYTRSIEDLYKLQEKGKKLPKIRTLNENRGYFENNSIVEVYKNSTKDIYVVTLEDGKQLKCTLDHRIFTNKGWEQLANLNVGDLVACNGLEIKNNNKGVPPHALHARSYYTNPVWLAQELQTKTPKQIGLELGCSYEVIKKYAYKFGLSWEIRKDHNKGKKLNLEHLTEEQRQLRKENALKNLAKAYEKNQLSGHPCRKLDTFDEKRVYIWQKTKRNELISLIGDTCANCGKQGKIHLHHKVSLKDDITLGYEPDNYEPLCPSCHSKEHKLLKAHFVKIVSIEFLRTDITYDIEVEGPFHNFISDGVVVHNCQSQRYTCERVLKLAEELVNCTREKCIDDADYDATVEELSNKIQSVFYFRPLGFYLDRQGNKYEYNELHLQNDVSQVWTALEHYYYNVKTAGYAPEHARDLLPQNIRQDFVMSMNARSLLHFCDLRLPADAQLEIRTLATMMFEHFGQWMPECAEWYEKHRAGRNKLSP